MNDFIPIMAKNLYIIAGCNGAGKTTASLTVLPEILDCREFVNADNIAKGLSPFQPEKVAVEAGRIMLERIEDLLRKGESFAIETTLATKIYRKKILLAQQQGYEITLLFFWLQSVEMAKQRVATRVSEGGHNIPTDVIERRYKNGIKNLFEIYLPIVDECAIFDNSNGNAEIIAKKETELEVVDKEKYNQLRSIYENTIV